jgi:hypothetical protein
MQSCRRAHAHAPAGQAETYVKRTGGGRSELPIREGSEQPAHGDWRSRPRANHRLITMRGGGAACMHARASSSGGVKKQEQPMASRASLLRGLRGRPGRASCVGGRWPTGAGVRSVDGRARVTRRTATAEAEGKEVWSPRPAGTRDGAELAK